MDCVEEALGRFRSVFGAEAVVEVVDRGPERLVAKFSGNMCYTCGTYDYFEDFAYMYSDCAGEEWAVESYRQNPDGSYTVIFKPKRLVRRVVRHVKITLEGKELDYLIEG
ncbi:hypothetical protein [Pyrobaculum sp.]|uniref:hypothetical protein n=1 Tax=Pyrobaculum sp. TaxID=2004705 RepID=UPI003D0B2F4D